MARELEEAKYKLGAVVNGWEVADVFTEECFDGNLYTLTNDKERKMIVVFESFLDLEKAKEKV